MDVHCTTESIKKRIKEEMILVFKTKRWFRNAQTFFSLANYADQDQKESTSINVFFIW
jgi:hypothetical protein